MSITYPIGYPTGNPMHNPKGHPNRPRIARIESARVVSSPLKSVWSSSTTSSSYVSARARDDLVATR